MSTALQFDAAAHRYYYEGVELMSVTRALKVEGLIETDWYSESARLRGQHVHEACAMLDDDDLDRVDPTWAPYVAAYDTFLRDSKPQWAYIEHRVYDRSRGYAGTVDRVGFLNGKWVLLDLKTGGEETWHRLQTAAYARLMPHATGLKPERFALYLRNDGTYRLKPMPDRNDEGYFLAALTMAQFKVAHGYRD